MSNGKLKIVYLLPLKMQMVGVIFLISISSAWSQNDTLILKNNDRLIGEIKKMERGILTIETDYSDDDFTVKWINISSINSARNYLITLNNGERFTAKIKTTEATDNITLISEEEVFSVSIKEIVYIKPVKSTFKSRLDASLSVGLNFTKSNNLKQLTVRSSLGYTARFWQLSGTYNAVRSNQDNTDEIQRSDGNLQFMYFLKHDYFAVLTSEFLSNDEQKLKLRLTNRLGLGKFIIHTNRFNLAAGGGIGWTSEKFYEILDDARNSTEAFGAIQLNMFDIKNIDLLTSLILYPSLTESKRLRLDYKIDLKYDLPWDFFIKFGLTYNFDNQPIEGASKEDYVVQTTFGWEL